MLESVRKLAVVLTAAMLVLTLEVTPTSQRELRTRISEVRGDVASAFLRAGTFQSPVRGVTVYLRDIEDRAKINPIRARVFGDSRPASTLVEVSKLVYPELLIEINAVAGIPSN